jgi:predicted metal-dependent hydrolase
VTAPMESTPSAIKEKVQKRAAWIIKQQTWFKQYDPRTPSRQYPGGETHLYLGKRYRLKISSGSEAGVRLVHGYFEVTCIGQVNTDRIKKLMVGWYREKAYRLFNEVILNFQQHYKIEPIPRLQIITMKKRWGSLSKGGILTLNISLIRAHRECIEYVIAHELCHIKHHNHSPDFYKLLSVRMPDWQKRKRRLEEALI